MENPQLHKLGDKFPSSDIEWRIGRSGKNDKGIWATCLAYITNRAIMERLDAVCGPENWKNEFAEWKVGDDHGVRCGISIRVGDEWVTKYDGAQPSNMEPIKGAFSDSMKRAAVQWGIGRYLYDLEEGFATVTEKKSGARYAKLAEKQGGDSFYWTPPMLPAWAMPDNVPADKPAKAADKPHKLLDLAVETRKKTITELCQQTGTDEPKLYTHFGKTPDTLDRVTADSMIASLQKKLGAQIDSAAA